MPSDDPDADRALSRIMDNPAYRRADRDTDFLELPEMRGPRLQLEYQKVELLLQEQRVHNTIISFGSTRIREPAEAERKLGEINEKLAHEPNNECLKTDLAIAQRLKAKSRYYEVAREFGRIIGRKGPAYDLTMMTGGGPGMMEAAARGSHDVDGRNVGLNIDLPHEQFPNPYVTPDLCFQFRYFAIRKLHFMLRAKAIVAFPGGYGTLDELFEAMTLIQTRTIKPVPVILVGREFWQGVVDFEYLAAEGVIDREDLAIFWYAESAKEIWHGILNWHEMNGTPLIPSED